MFNEQEQISKCVIVAGTSYYLICTEANFLITLLNMLQLMSICAQYV